MTNDVDALDEMYSGILVRLFRNIIMIIGLASVMLILDWNALPRPLENPGLGNVEHKSQHQNNRVLQCRLLNDAVIPLVPEQIHRIPNELGTVQVNGCQGKHQPQMELRRGRTTIVIAHRISTLQKADHVAVLTEGKLTEYGTHEELLEKNGFYAHIYEKQQLEQGYGPRKPPAGSAGAAPGSG